MQLAKPTLIVLAALMLLGSAASAKGTKPKRAETEDAPVPCFSYQLDSGGHWAQLPCQEMGTHASSQHRVPSKGHDGEPHQ